MKFTKCNLWSKQKHLTWHTESLKSPQSNITANFCTTDPERLQLPTLTVFLVLSVTTEMFSSHSPAAALWTSAVAEFMHLSLSHVYCYCDIAQCFTSGPHVCC